MARKRKFEQYTTNQKYMCLINCITYAMSELNDKSLKRKTDTIGIACQYGQSYGVRRKDFEMIMDVSFNELIEIMKE